MKRVLVALAGLLSATPAVAQISSYPLQASVNGTEIVLNNASRTYAYMTTAQIAAYAGGQGGGVNAQTGTTYTIAATDAGKLLTFSNGSAVAVTLPAATTAGFGAGKVFYIENLNTGAVTITPTTSTINGSATLVINQNRGVMLVSDGTNYQIQTGAAGLLATPATVPEGGTGAATLTNHGVLVGAGTGAVTPLSVGTNGQILVGASSANPAFQTLSGDVTSVTSGGVLTLGKVNGITMPSSVTSGGVPYYSSTSAEASSAALTANAVVIGGGAGNPPTTIAAGTTGQLLVGGSGAPAFGVTLGGAYVFTNALIQAGATAGTPTHFATGQTTAPALTSCGTGSPSIVGTDTAGIVTMGTGATGCTITFNVAYTATPYCVVTWIASPLASQSYATSNTAITLTQTSTSGNKAQYICMAQAGG